VEEYAPKNPIVLLAVLTADMVAVPETVGPVIVIEPRIICLIVSPSGVQFVVSDDGSVTPPPLVFLMYGKNVTIDTA
jgi:hypothetical protein